MIFAADRLRPGQLGLTEGFESGDDFVIVRIVEISHRIRTRQDQDLTSCFCFLTAVFPEKTAPRISPA